MHPVQNIRRCVLLVEDEPLVAMVATDSLNELGFDVVEAISAKGAVDLAKAGIDKFALAVVDLGLPDRPGEDVVAEIKTLRAEFPVIVASGRGADRDAHFEKFSRVVVVSKPYDFSDFRASIEALGLILPAV